MTRAGSRWSRDDWTPTDYFVVGMMLVALALMASTFVWMVTSW